MSNKRKYIKVFGLVFFVNFLYNDRSSHISHEIRFTSNNNEIGSPTGTIC
ncbi:hypothetical protein GCM10008915_77460 [Bifidobacterium pullorum subsp. gallinarum]